MLDYEEYYFGAEKGKIKYDYQKMGDMILDKKTDLMFWKQITVYELMDYACILCAYWDESMLETFRSEQNKTEIYDKVSGVCQYSCHFSFFIWKTMRLPPHHPHFLCLPFFLGSGKPFRSMSSL